MPVPRAHSLFLVMLLLALVPACDRSGVSQPTPPALPPHPASARPAAADHDAMQIQIGKNLPPYAVQLHLKTIPNEGRLVQSVDLWPAPNPARKQTLIVHDPLPLPDTVASPLSLVDLNFDGYCDIGIITSQGTANTYLDYWLFAPATGQFQYLGHYPLLDLDPAQRQLTSDERGGSGGLLHETKRYQFIDGVFTLVEQETVAPTDRPDRFRKTTLKLQNGRLRPYRAETIPGP